MFSNTENTRKIRVFNESEKCLFAHLCIYSSMLCGFCSSIDLGQLSTTKGYKHHSRVAALLESTCNGCESCAMILKGQWVELGGDVQSSYDQGPLETQIIATGFGQRPGSCDSIRNGQVAYHKDWNL
jgi:hypothetical protein